MYPQIDAGIAVEESPAECREGDTAVTEQQGEKESQSKAVGSMSGDETIPAAAVAIDNIHQIPEESWSLNTKSSTKKRVISNACLRGVRKKKRKRIITKRGIQTKRPLTVHIQSSRKEDSLPFRRKKRSRSRGSKFSIASFIMFGITGD